MAENLLAWLADPNVAYLLFVLGLLGIIGELVTAGTLVPGTLGAISLILALVGLKMLAAKWLVLWVGDSLNFWMLGLVAGILLVGAMASSFSRTTATQGKER